MNFYRISIRQMITDVVVVILLTSMVIIGTKAGVTWLKTHIWDFFTPFLMTFFLLQETDKGNRVFTGDQPGNLSRRKRTVR